MNRPVILKVIATTFDGLFTIIKLKKSDSFEGQVWFSDIIATAASAGDEFTKLTNGPLKPFFVQDNWELNQLGRAVNTLMLIILTFATLMNF